MTEAADLRARARAILDANRYLTMATAAPDGTPWANPVWFASVDPREFFWVSSPTARHSRNIAARPQMAAVVFDSQQVPGTGQAVYVSGRAELVPDADIDRGIEVYSQESQGLSSWSRDDVQGSAQLRLYRLTVHAHFVLTPGDQRVPVDLT
jgi:pyridoxine/pyridoxamine 5'-phosphate oxidase